MPNIGDILAIIAYKGFYTISAPLYRNRYTKMIKGYLRLVVMNALSDRKLSGYELKKQIEKNTGTWKPSYASIYPLLEKLLSEGLASYKAEGRSKVYYLTSEGKKKLPEMNKGKNTLADSMNEAVNAFGKIIDPKEKEFITEVFNSIRQGKLPFSEFNPELGEFRAAVFNAHSKGKDKKKVKSILKKAIGEIRSIK